MNEAPFHHRFLLDHVGITWELHNSSLGNARACLEHALLVCNTTSGRQYDSTIRELTLGQAAYDTQQGLYSLQTQSVIRFEQPECSGWIN